MPFAVNKEFIQPLRFDYNSHLLQPMSSSFILHPLFPLSTPSFHSIPYLPKKWFKWLGLKYFLMFSFEDSIRTTHLPSAINWFCLNCLLPPSKQFPPIHYFGTVVIIVIIKSQILQNVKLSVKQLFSY